MKRELADGTIIEVSFEEIAQIEAERADQQAVLEATAWLRGRKADYLSIEDQLDMIYWDMKNGTSTFVDRHDSVKAANPKPA